ncbi:MAG: hypothetical protein ACRD19_15035 [Terriglobia bacterium]
MRRPRVFRDAARRWCIEFVLEGEYTVWRTAKWADALRFAFHLLTLQAEGLRRA